MNSQLKTGLWAGLVFISGACTGGREADSEETMEQSNSVTLVRNDAEKKVEVLVDGKLFTAYLYPETIAKPVLYPIKSSQGMI